MDVTKLNFETLFPQIKKHIESCDFLAIDFELTGLESSEAAAPSVFDSLQERYTKLRASVTSLAPTQIGLCPTKIDLVTGKLTILPYNVWLYPRPHPMAGFEPRFMVQASSFSFLSDNHFDFNKWVSQGVSWLPGVYERKAIESGALSMENMTQVPATSNNNDIPLDQIKNPNDKQLLQDALSEIRKWNESEASEEHPLHLSAALNPFVRRLVYQEGRNQFPSLILETVQHPESPSTKVIRVSKMTPEQRHKAALETFDRSLGFRRVFKVIQSASKPIILHNGLLDLMHYMHNFGDTELPESLADFKLAIQSALSSPSGFPIAVGGSVYDTSMFCSEEFAPTKIVARGLEKIFQYSLAPQRSVQVDENGKEISPKQPASELEKKEESEKPSEEEPKAEPKTITVGFPALELDLPSTFGRYIEPLKKAIEVANPQVAVIAVVPPGSSPSVAPVSEPSSSVPPVAPAPKASSDAIGAVDMKSLAHEAGYDAMMTAVVFGKLIAASQFYPSSTQKKEEKQEVVEDMASSALATSSAPWNNLVQRAKGKVNLMRSDIKYLDVLNAQTEPSRAHYFRVSGLTVSIRNEHIEQAFASFGGLKRIVWANATECIAILNDESKSSEVAAAVCGSADIPFNISALNRDLESFSSASSSSNNSKRHRVGAEEQPAAAEDDSKAVSEANGKRAKPDQ